MFPPQMGRVVVERDKMMFLRSVAWEDDGGRVSIRALSAGVDLRVLLVELVRFHGRTAMIWLMENLEECRWRTGGVCCLGIVHCVHDRWIGRCQQ